MHIIGSNMNITSILFCTSVPFSLLALVPYLLFFRTFTISLSLLFFSFFCTPVFDFVFSQFLFVFLSYFFITLVFP